MKRLFILISMIMMMPFAANAQKKNFDWMDVFEIEYANDPQFTADGESIIYVRTFMDVMKDRKRSNLWIVDTDGDNHRPLTMGLNNNSNPRISPDGTMLAYTSNESGKSQIMVRFMDTGKTHQVAQLQNGASRLSWSPDSSMIAFSAHVDGKPKSYASLPKAPKGAEWAKPAIYIDELQFRRDGSGYVKPGNSHIFVVPALGGTPHQVTSGEFNHSSDIAWAQDGETLYFSANRHDNHKSETRDSEIYSVNIASGEIAQMTGRFGPDSNPKISPDGRRIAYVGYDDNRMGYHNSHVYVMDVDGTNIRDLTPEFDRSVGTFHWVNNAIYFQYTDKGINKISRVNMSGDIYDVTEGVSGTSFGRPYAGGTFNVSKNGEIAMTYATALDQANIGHVDRRGGDVTQITDINADLLNHRKLGRVEEVWYKSSHDGLDIQGWLVYPTDFDASKKYPLILEIHGGPFAAYGPHFAAELQLMANKGYMVLYTNPRGSTSYGYDFANEIHHNYPSNDYDDLISGVDHVISMGNVDPDKLYVTGGSGGGVLSSWIIGKTDRFKAAVVAKPVINWTSFTLYSDMSLSSAKYWFGAMPWDDQEQYWRRSPLSLVGNVSTPTMLLTGEADLRTPMPESEQYYQALKMREVEASLVRIPGAFHGITARPSNLITKIQHVVKWFDEHP
ncbi:S9 family peptidase [Pseudemcibacter aquimaris]|uniref:S9 family peptidase n=1 Tax=Pseudemcibacter aquimaris TaxID=2857064 RepID=UPI002012FA1B|nr:S9 family peptidase [Pseudemcibacter aquimaris]MCC3859621.1 S9 family peptidase [Pseudemcibacter aquimaris]WDU60016.1 S9 family peptidase [Pseudemcibacter aquimaris]